MIRTPLWFRQPGQRFGADRSTQALLALIWVFIILLIALGLISAIIAEVVFQSSLPWQPSEHHDFLAFIATAQLTLHGHIAEVYNPTYQTSYQRAIINHPVGAAGFMPYLNPPFLAALLSPLALLRPVVSRIAWLLFNSAVLVGSVIYLLRIVKIRGRKLWLFTFLIIGSFPVYQALSEGQVSVLMLGGATLGYYLFRSKRNTWAGVALAVLWIKPQLALIALFQLLWLKQYRAAIGIIIGGLMLVLIFLPITGIGLNFQYLGFLANVASDHLHGAGALGPSLFWSGSLSLTEGINGLYVSVFGQQATLLVNLLTAIFDSCLIALFLFTSRRLLKEDATDRLVLISVLTALLLDPHLYAQDLVLLILLVPASARITKTPSVGLLALVSGLTLVIIDQLTRVHVFTVMTLCLIIATSLPKKNVLAAK